MSTQQKKTEYWDLYRMDGRFERTIEKGSMKIPDHLYHETVEIIPTDKEGHLLVTRRSQTKRIAGGKFEFPAGSVHSGESPVKACHRELMEETGLKAQRMYKLASCIIPGLKRYIYLAHIPDLMTAEIRLQEEETISYALVTFEEWLEYVSASKFDENRLKMYNKAVLDNMEKMVGTPAGSDIPRKVRSLSLTTGLGGTRSGASGQDTIFRDKDMDDLANDPIEVFDVEEEPFDEET